MLVTGEYNRERALEYARKWALERNPLFTDYAGIGGDCTSFASQTLYAGSCKMNFTPITGWYYISDSQRTASWTGVQFLYNFLVSNTGVGPYGRDVFADEALPGDLIQLSDEDGNFYHTLIILGSEDGEFIVAAHNDDSLDRPLSTYTYSGLRYIHIDGVRYSMAEQNGCFASLLDGTDLSVN